LFYLDFWVGAAMYFLPKFDEELKTKKNLKSTNGCTKSVLSKERANECDVINIFTFYNNSEAFSHLVLSSKQS
jgi:hypothetical protein